MTYFHLRAHGMARYKSTRTEKCISSVLIAIALVTAPLVVAGSGSLLLSLLSLLAPAIIGLIGWEARHLYLVPAINLAWISNLDDAARKAIINDYVETIH